MNAPGSAMSESQPHRQRIRSDLLLAKAIEIIETSRPMPLSSSVMINRDEVLQILNDAVARLPEELRAARWLLKEREEFLEKSRRDSDDLIAEAQSRVAHMMQRSEVVRAAENEARRIIEEAEEIARTMRLEAADFCDHRLGSFEAVLERTIKVVQAGRAKLAVTAPLRADDDNEEIEDPAGFFDQDDA